MRSDRPENLMPDSPVGGTNLAQAGRQAGRQARLTLTKKIGLLLFLPFVVSLAAAFIFFSYLSSTRNFDHVLNVAGRQRMLAAEMRNWVHMVAIGQEEDRTGLRTRMEEFEQALLLMQVGGRVAGGNAFASGEYTNRRCHECHSLRSEDVAHAPPITKFELTGVAALWKELRPDILTVVEAPRGEAGFVEAVTRVDKHLPELRVLSNNVVVAIMEQHRLDHDRLFSMLAASSLIIFMVFLAGLFISKRFIVRSVLGVEQAARRIQNGDFSTRLAVSTRDEIGALALTFNQMTEQIERLLDAINLRRKHAETIINSVPAWLLVCRKDLTVLRVNHSFREAFGLNEAAATGKSVTDLLPALGLREAALEVISSGETKRGLLVEMPWNDGTRSLRVTIAGTHLAEEEEEEEEVLVIAEDISEEKRLAERAHVSEHRFRTLIEMMPDGVLVSGDGVLRYVNPVATAWLGYERAEELIGRPVTDVFAEDERDEVRAHVCEAKQNGRLPPHEHRMCRADGTIMTWEMATALAMFDGAAAVVILARDVSERKNLQVRMMQMDRIIAVGTLAAGVAHEINNPLAYVISNLEFLAGARGAGHEQSPAELDQALAEAREGAERVRKIVLDLKVFSRAEEDRREQVSLPGVIESAINMAWNEIRHRAKLVKNLDPIPIVDANEARLGQVFLNLFVNAAHAIPEGHVEENKISVTTRTDVDGRAIIEVRDTGSGIPADVLPRIFDPFFTTKPVGQGTGLGLSICRNIVLEFGGNIEVESEVGKGTVFRVTLPPARVGTPITEAPQPTVVQPARRGRILIVDDEPAVGRAMRRILAREHDVVEAVTSGQEALTRLTAEPFDIILCDLMMPTMTGMDFFAEVNRRFPDRAKRIIFLSGGAFTPEAREFLDRVPNPKLEKPVDSQILRAIIRELLC